MVTVRLQQVKLSLPLLLLCVSCSVSPESNLSRTVAGGFKLTALPDNLQAAAPACPVQMRVRSLGEAVQVEVLLREAHDLKALFVALDYDPQSYQAVSAAASGLLASGSRAEQPLIELAVLDQPGQAVHGQVLARPQSSAGFSGSGTAAVFTLNRLDSARQAPSTRRISLAPETDASGTILSLDVPASELRWNYYCQGDYDQNGEVNIADLTPLGQHFGAAGPFLINSAAAVIDGDSNGEINLSDLTPIGLNYGRRVTAYRVYESANAADYPDSNAEPSVLDATGFTALSAGDPTSERLRYSFALAEVVPGASYWVRPIDGGVEDPAASEGTPSNTVSDIAPGNLPPVAVLGANPSAGLAPLLARLSANDSSDPDGEIVLYEWDFDGDGLYDLTSLEEFCEVTLAEAGEHIVAVRVTDNLGASSVDGVLIFTTEAAGWSLSIPVASPYLGFWVDEISDPLIVQGNPAFAFEYRYEGMYYCRSNNAEGSAWPAPVFLEEVSQHKDDLSLALVEGRPALAFPGTDNTNLYFLRSADALGAAWGAPQQLIASAGIYRPRLLFSGNGLPIIAYLGTAGAGDNISAILADDAQGLQWGGPIEVSAGEAGFGSPALTLVGGEPALTYQHSSGNTMYCRSTAEPDGSLWLENVVFDPPSLNDGSFRVPGLAEAAGRPAIAFGFIGPGDPEHLAFVRADAADGSAWPIPAILDDSGELGCSPAMITANARPLVAYSTIAGAGPSEELRLLRSVDAEGSAWNAPEVLGIFPDIRRLFALELIDGRVALLLRTYADAEDPRLITRAVYFAVENSP